LVNYIQRNEGKDSMQIYLVSITRIRDELNRWIKTNRQAAAQKVMFNDLSEIKPPHTPASQGSVEDDVEEEEFNQTINTSSSAIRPPQSIQKQKSNEYKAQQQEMIK
jgi:hypothetical protein